MLPAIAIIHAALITTTLTGRVVSVSDGDTCKILTADKREIRVRLAEIDAPESSQDFGKRAKQKLSELVFGRDVRVEVQTTDRYGRTVGRIYVDDLDVNAELVRSGAAWVYRRYMRDKSLLQLEEQARTAKVGLWADPSPTPPWEYRRAKRTGSGRTTKATPQPPPTPSNSAFICGSKRYCREMSSCAEARAYLLQCGVRRLDGDGDGVPCEALCRH